MDKIMEILSKAELRYSWLETNYTACKSAIQSIKDDGSAESQIMLDELAKWLNELTKK